MKKYRTVPCPDCDGHTIARSLVQATCWCPRCERVWKVQRDNWSWRVYWYFENRDRPKDDMKRHNPKRKSEDRWHT